MQQFSLCLLSKSEKQLLQVGWVSVANHAGGYSWSLCRAGQPLTEDCFDQVPLQFATNTSKLRYMFLEEVRILQFSKNQFDLIRHVFL